MRADFSKQEGDLNLAIFDGSVIEENEIILACETAPFLGNRRLAIVRDFNFKKSVERLAEFVEHLPDFCTLVFTAVKPDARTALFKRIKKHGQIREFPAMKPVEFKRWLKEEVGQREIKITIDALNLLAIFTIGDCQSAVSELAKLRIYADGQVISKSDVEMLVHPDLHTSVFRLTDAIGMRQIESALSYLVDITRRGENLVQIFFMIVRQFRILIGIKACLEKRLPAARIASELKLPPFVVNTTISQARNFTGAELQLAYRRLLEIDAGVKSGRVAYTTNNIVELVLELEKFIIRFA